jgi:hypothetical protein
LQVTPAGVGGQSINRHWLPRQGASLNVMSGRTLLVDNAMLARSVRLQFMIDEIFSACVQALVWLAQKVGMTYEEVNVWLFCVLWPALTLTLIGVILWQRKLRR